MMIDTAIQIITDENLYIRKYNWFEDRETRMGELGVVKKDDKWLIYSTDEDRGWFLSAKLYFFLSETLDQFIHRMRAGKRITDKHWQRWSEQNKVISYENYLVGLEDIKNRQEKQYQEWLACKDRIYSLIS